MEKNSTPNMVGFFSGSDKDTTQTNPNTSDLEARTLDNDIHSAGVSVQHSSEMTDLESRVANVHVTENCSDSKENLEKLSTDSDVAKCDPRNVDTEGLEWNGDKVKVANGVLEWNGNNVEVDTGDTELDDDDDDTGWITPDNFRQACEELGGVLEEKAAGIAVGCTTTDFAMQVCIDVCVREGRGGEESERLGGGGGGKRESTV